MWNILAVGTQVSILIDGQTMLGCIERSFNVHEYDVRLSDGRLIERTWSFEHRVPSVIVPINTIPDLVSVETGKPVHDLPGYAFIDFYYIQDGTEEIRWRRYREYRPADAYLMIWAPAEAIDGLLSEHERAYRDMAFAAHEEWQGGRRFRSLQRLALLSLSPLNLLFSGKHIA